MTKKIYEITCESGACDECINHSGKYTEIPAQKPPFHINCKCKLVERNANNDDFIDEVFDDIKDFEGEEFNAYTDTKGNVTIGYGSKIETEADFKKLPLTFNNRLATDEEKEVEFQRLNNNPDKGSILSLENKDKYLIENMAKNHLKEDLKIAKQKFKNYGVNFDSLPEEAKKVIVDMQYNMGGNFTSSKWPMFFEAIKEREWKTAARESQSYDIQLDRNNWRKRTLEDIIE